MPLARGQILSNRYRIEELLGQGGFGAVYKAWDLNLERWRALKENLEASPEAQRQFKREAQILCDLAHPNLPRVIDHFVVLDPSGGSGSAYLVMDYVEGEDLEKMLLHNGGPLPEAQVVAWLIQVCEALEYLHSQQQPVIHRDIKPANIKITPAGKAMLVDFGIAKLFDPNLRTSVGARAYTSGYSPPEQYGRGATDAQSDVYALGATAYHLLTGRLPPDSVDLLSGSTAPLPAAQEANPAITPQVSTALRGAMQLNRASRCKSVSELKAALRPSPPVPLPDGEKGVKTAVLVQPATPHARTLPLATAAPANWRHDWLGNVRLVGLVLACAILLVLIIWGLSTILSGGRHTPIPENSQLALTTEARQTELVAAEVTLTRIALLKVMVETQQAMQTLISSTRTAAYETSITRTSVPETHTTQTPTVEKTATRTMPSGIILPPLSKIIDPKDVPMALIPAGEVQIGSRNGGNNEKPVHTVRLDAFYIDLYETTNARYAKCVSAGACQPPIASKSYTRDSYYGDSQYADYPVIYTTWEMAKAYCEWRGGSLPTEAQWEKAARGGLQGMDYPWGNENPVCEKGAQNGANFGDCGANDTEAVGDYSPNGYGLYDMAGNVWEWVNDWYQSNVYAGSPGSNPSGPTFGDYKVLRGGSWDSILFYIRVAYRDNNNPISRDDSIGFRCAASPGR